MRVPAPDLGKCDLESDIRLGELSDLSERLSERRRGVGRSIFGLVLCWIGGLQHLHGIERFTPGTVEHLVGSRRVFRFERGADQFARLTGADAELRELADGYRGRAALQHP